MENQLVVVLPQEVAQIAENVSVEKRNEVQAVLNHVFNGVSKMREQLDGVTVYDANDKVNMKLANTIRLGVRQVRLEAEKTFDAKRAEVQQQMLSYKTEDSLWLKAKQTMQILTKEIEENARWKEETKERYEAEQKELKVQQRMLKVAKVAPEMARTEFENMSDETFEIFYAGIEKAYNDKIEADKKEVERLEAERLAEIARQKAIEDENKRLKAEAEEKRIRDEKRNKELRPFIVFIRDYNKMLSLPEDEYVKEFLDIKKGAESHWEFERKEQIRLQAEAEAKEKQLAEERAKAEAKRKAIEEAAKKEREEAERKLKAEQETARIAAEKAAAEKAKLEAEIKAKAEAEEKARKEAEAKVIAEQKAKEVAEKKAKNAPDKTKLIELAAQIDGLNMPEIKGEEAQKILSDVKTLLSKVAIFIREKSSGL